MPARRHFRALLCAAAVAVTAPASAQESKISLEETMGKLFQSSPAFQTYGAQTQVARAIQLRASGAFDVLATGAAQGQRTLFPASSGMLSDQGYHDLSL